MRKKWMPWAAFQATSGSRSRQLASARRDTWGRPSASNVRRRQELRRSKLEGSKGRVEMGC